MTLVDVPVVDGVDAIVFTHGSDGGDKAGAERVDYGGVRSVLAALDGRSVRISLMTAIGVTNREGDYNRQTEAHDWKRRGERLVRASGLPYTIVRPGWFDYNKPDEHRLVLLQGIAGMPATPATGSSRVAISPRSWSPVLRLMGRCAKASNSSPPKVRRSPTLIRSSRGSIQTHRALWTRFTTCRTCRCRSEPDGVRHDLEAVSRQP